MSRRVNSYELCKKVSLMGLIAFLHQAMIWLDALTGACVNEKYI